MHLLRFTTLAILLLLSPALAHESWINREKLTDPASKEWCCNRNDCRSEQVRETNGGYVVTTGEFVPFHRVIWKSEDGHWWRCRYMAGERAGKTRCLIGPSPGS